MFRSSCQLERVFVVNRAKKQIVASRQADVELLRMWTDCKIRRALLRTVRLINNLNGRDKMAGFLDRPAPLTLRT